jgi:four helix bundle protein
MPTAAAMTTQEMKDRTRRFALDVIRFTRTLTRSDEGRVLGRQLFRAGTAVGANYRAACRPRSDADFVSKMGVLVEEADECAYWIEIMIEARLVTRAAAAALHDEADQLTRIFVASRETVRRRLRKRRTVQSRIQNPESRI